MFHGITRPKPRSIIRVSGGGAPTLNYVGKSVQGTTAYDHATDTHGPFSIGPSQAGNKLVIVSAYLILAFAITDGVDGSYVQCNSVTMPVVGASNFTSQRQPNLFQLEVPGSTTSVTITVTDRNAGLQGSLIGVYWGSGYASAVASSHAEVPYQLVNTPGTISTSFTVPANGFAIYMGVDGTAGEATTLGGTPVTQDDLINGASFTPNQPGEILACHLTTPGAATITLAGTGGGYDLCSAAAAWS